MNHTHSDTYKGVWEIESRREMSLFGIYPVFSTLNFIFHSIESVENTSISWLFMGIERIIIWEALIGYLTSSRCPTALLIYDFNLGLIHKAALAYNESS